MTNGSLRVISSTIVENEVSGIFAIFNNKPNMEGGSIAATIGNAYEVNDMKIWHSIIAGNLVRQPGRPLHWFSLQFKKFWL